MSSQTHEARFLRKVGLINIWAIGIVPLVLILWPGVIVIEPYVSGVAIAFGVVITRYAKNLTTIRKIQDD